MSDGAWKIQKLASEGLPDRAADLAELFPEAITDGKVDVEKLKFLLGDSVEESPERYGLTWPGKRDAIRLVQKQSTGTLDPMHDDSVDFDTTKNVIVEGDNLEVLKLLQKSYYGLVKLVYIDPPYNTGKDFVYKDDFAEPTAAYLRRSGQTDEGGFRRSANKEASGRFHSDWLSMMYPRLVVARNLLRSDGCIFVSIADHEIANLRLILDEVFGSENFVAQIIWKKRNSAPNDRVIGTNHDYVLCYAKDGSKVRLNLRLRQSEQLDRYRNPDNHPKGPWVAGDMTANVKGGRYVESLHYGIENPNTGEVHYPGNKGNWRYNSRRVEELLENNEIYFGLDGKGKPKVKRFLSDVKSGMAYPTIWDFVPFNTQGSTEMESLFGDPATFESPKPVGLLEEIVATGSGEEDIVLDFFAGSGTTAEAVLRRNLEETAKRRTILVQLPEPSAEKGFATLADITRERVRRAGKKIKEEAGDKAADLDVGFRAFKLAESKFRNWDSETDTFLSEELDFFVDNISSTASDEDVVHEIMLKAGIRLDTDLRKVQIAGEDVYLALEGLFVTSAVRKITQEFIDGLLALNPWPQQVVLLDSGFGDNDSLKLNARHQFASRRPDSDPDKDNALRTV